MVKEWELDGIKSARSESSFRDLLEEMVMAGRFMMRARPHVELRIPLAFRHPRRAAKSAFSREKAAECASQMVGSYNSVEHRAYVDTISEGGCHNVVAACFDDSVPMRPDPKFGKLIKAGERYSRLATPLMIAVGSHLRDTCGKVKPQVVLGLGVLVAPMPKIPRPPSSRKRKAPSPDLADVAESRSPLRESMDMHLAGKIDIEKILPPLPHERAVFSQRTGLQLVVDTSS